MQTAKLLSINIPRYYLWPSVHTRPTPLELTVFCFNAKETEMVLTMQSLLSQDLYPYPANPLLNHTNLLSGNSRQINNPAFHKWAPIIDLYDNRTVIIQIRNSDDRIKWQSTMSRSHSVFMIQLTTGSFSSMKFVGIKGCHSGLH